MLVNWILGHGRGGESTSRSGSIGALARPLKPSAASDSDQVTDAAESGSASGALGYAGDCIRVERHLLRHAFVGVALDVTQAVDDQ